ncbi:MAG: hypothetical protein AAF726_09155 [Planctomycetota bacterium]
MKWTTATLLATTLSAAGAGLWYVATRPPEGPRAILEEVRSQMDSVLFDPPEALRNLDQALRQIDGELNDEAGVGEERAKKLTQTRIDVLGTRAEIHGDLGQFRNAQDDIATMLAVYADVPEPDREFQLGLELELARLETINGEEEEALQRVRAILERDGEFAAAWAFAGELEAAVALGFFVEAHEAVDEMLTAKQAQRAKELLTELAARDERDAQNSNLRAELERIFEFGDKYSTATQSELYDALSTILDARPAFGRSREAFARSIELEPNARRVVEYGSALRTAGQLDYAISLQQAAQPIESVRTDPDALAALLVDLSSADRMSEAQRSLKTWKGDAGGTLEFYRSAAEIVYRSGNLGPLRDLGSALIDVGGELGNEWGRFLRDVAVIDRTVQREKGRANLKALEDTAKSLRDFARESSSAVEPFPGAKIDAWFYLAELYNFLEQPGKERAALQEGLRRRPDGSVDAWIRFAEALAASKPTPWRDVEEAYTNALDLDPSRTADIAPAWYEAARRNLAGRGLTVQAVIGEVARFGSPLREVSPAVHTMLAQDHLAKGQNFAALQSARRALQDHPNLVPPVDVIIAAKLREPSRYDVDRDIVERIEAAGIDERVEGFLSQLPEGSLKGDSLVRAIRAAPERFGPPEVARWYRKRGEPGKAGEALESIQSLEGEEAPASLRLLRAQTLFDEGLYDKAIDSLETLGSDPQLGSEALVLRARAMVRSGRPERLDPIVREMLAGNPSPSVALEMADVLMESGRPDLALVLVDLLDASPETRTPEFYRRRVLVDVLLVQNRGPLPARESIIRAEAYLGDGTPELAAILFAVATRQWTELPDLVERVRESDLVLSDEQEVALMLLEERLEAGGRAAEAGLAAAPRDPAWAFLDATASALVDEDIVLPDWFGPRAADDALRLLNGPTLRFARDPREALVIFLLSDVPGWAPWLLPIVTAVGENTKSTIWAPWLEIRIRETREDDEIRRLVERIIETEPQFGPAHGLALELASEVFPTEPLHPQIVRIRRRRLESLGADLIDDPVEVAIAEAGELARLGRNDEAIVQLQQILKQEGVTDTKARFIQGLLQIRALQPALAAQYLFDAAMGDPGIFRTIVIDSLLLSIEASLRAMEEGIPQRGGLGREDALEMLDQLAARYPLDPVVALAQLRLQDLAEGERGPRARGILDTMFRRSGRRTLEDLRSGSTAAWVRYLSPVAPDVAQEVVSRDLALDPGSLELWQLSGQAAEAAGDREEARIAYETLLAIDPQPETGYALAELLITDGAPRNTLEGILRTADTSRGGGTLRSIYLRALADLHGPSTDNPQKLDIVVERTKTLWNSRARGEVDPLAVGLLYVDALFLRGTREDLAKLGKVLSDLAPIANERPYAGGLVSALEGIRATRAAEERRSAARAAAEASEDATDQGADNGAE